jgi:hypothetical protein
MGSLAIGAVPAQNNSIGYLLAPWQALAVYAVLWDLIISRFPVQDFLVQPVADTSSLIVRSGAVPNPPILICGVILTPIFVSITMTGKNNKRTKKKNRNDQILNLGTPDGLEDSKTIESVAVKAIDSTEDDNSIAPVCQTSYLSIFQNRKPSVSEIRP